MRFSLPFLGLSTQMYDASLRVQLDSLARKNLASACANQFAQARSIVTDFPIRLSGVREIRESKVSSNEWTQLIHAGGLLFSFGQEIPLWK
jgi:hypothetical protein